jgi:hypothetical protein
VWKVSYSLGNNKRPPEISSSLYVDLKDVELLELFLLVLFKSNLKDFFLEAKSRSAIQEYVKFDGVNKSHILK